MLRVAPLVALVPILAACGSDAPTDDQRAITLCMDRIKELAKDPDAVQTKDVKVANHGEPTKVYAQPKESTVRRAVGSPMSGEVESAEVEWTITGAVNVRNSFGAYVGFRDFECSARIVAAEHSNLNRAYLVRPERL